MIKDKMLIAALASMFLLLSALGVQTARVSAWKKDYAVLHDAVERQKGEAAQKLGDMTRRALEAERVANTANNKLKEKDDAHKSELAAASKNLAARTRAGGGTGLRDPHAIGCRSGGGSASGATAPNPVDSAGSGADASGILSEQFERDLVAATEKADTINRAYAVCRGYVTILHAACTAR